MNKNICIGYRPTWAEINLKNLDYNFDLIKKMISSKTKIMVTIKADAYGHGLIPVARRLAKCQVDYLGVASVDEGIKLRMANIKLPILILGVILKEHIGPLFDYDLATTVCALDFASLLDKKAKRFSKQAKVHIKIDTGMGRIGVGHRDAFNIVKKIYSLRGLKVEGIFTHFAFADINKNFTNYQINLFNQLVAKINKARMHIPLVHAANSAGVINYGAGHFNMVRPGLVIYGLYPSENLDIKLKPVLSLKTKVVYLKRVPKNCGISYGHAYITEKPATIVTLPIGYGDGYPRNLSNLAPVLIGGKRFKVSGRICMDQIMVDVGNNKVVVGDEVVLIGSQGKNKITCEEIARLCGTIPYEIVCGLGSRIPRVYV